MSEEERFEGMLDDAGIAWRRTPLADRCFDQHGRFVGEVALSWPWDEKYRLPMGADENWNPGRVS